MIPANLLLHACVPGLNFTDISTFDQIVVLLVQGLSSPFEAARYHSLVIDAASCPPELEVTAQTDDGLIMAVRHRQYPTCQVSISLLLAFRQLCLRCSWS